MTMAREVGITTVHLCNYSSHNSIQIWCDESWDTAKWGLDEDKRTDDPEVYVADTDRLYTFNEKKVTCLACQNKKEANPA